MASLSRRLERFLFILMALMAHLPAVLLHNHCSSNFNVTYDNEVIIARGGGTCLFCDYSGTSQSPPEWYRGTSVITDGNLDDPCDCTIPENSRMLCFEQVTDDAARDYSCRVQTGFGQSDDCLFTVSLAVRPRIIEPFPAENYNLTEAETLIIPLNISPGSPPATVEWTKDGSVVSRETNLTVPNVNAQHRGMYTVTISNIGGSESRNFNVYVQFLEVEVIAPVRMDNGMYEVRCEISGYPQLSFVRWSTPDGNLLATDTDILKNMFEDEITTTLTLSQEECSASDSFMCVASTRNGGRTSSSSTSGCSSISRIRVSVLSSTSVLVEWNQPVMARNTFIIKYRQLQNGQIDQREVPNTETSVVIGGLMAGNDYEFTGLIEENDSGNNAVTVTLMLCTNPGAAPSVPTNVRASTNVRPSTNVDNNVREISVSWDGSTSISNYRLYIKVSNGTETSVIVSGNATTYTLAPRTYQCSNNVVYTFIVQGLNRCGEGGQNSSSVDVTCSAMERRATISSITTYSTAINIQWTTMDNKLPEPPLSLTALQIKVIDGEQYKLNYTTNMIISGAFCMGELEKDTLYEVCLHPTFNVNGVVESESVCMFAMTLAVDNEDVGNFLDQCIKPVKRTSQISVPSPAAFPDYAIAVIVVGVLGIIALIFCFIGLCFACHSSKQKEDFGSTSSLQAPSEPMHNHRSMSPSRSCLSYHTKGHSTNWSDHVDTLRQMETDTGTHV